MLKESYVINIHQIFLRDISKRYQDLIHERNGTDGAWGSIGKALSQIDKLMDERTDDESQEILKATKEKIESMKIG